MGRLILQLIPLLVFSLQCRAGLPPTDPDFIRALALSGRVAQEYETVTDDGYILKLYRIPPSQKCWGRVKKTPVLLMHAITQQAGSFLDAGVDNGLAYLVSDDCHDTWLGNQRGTYESRHHIKLDPDSAEYWNFSFHEMGVYDLPAIIDCVLKVTGAPKLNYIGVSQGQGVFYIMCSERYGYAEKVGFAIGLSPCTRQLNTKSVAYRESTSDILKYRSKLRQAGIYRIISADFYNALDNVCKALSSIGEPCRCANGFLDFPHPDSISADTLYRLTQHYPVGNALKMNAHYGQNINNDVYRKFDYGPTTNLDVYGSILAPAYDLSRVTTRVLVISGTNDAIVDPIDHDWAAKKLPNLEKHVKIQGWNHLDMVYNKHINNTLYPTIRFYLNKYDC